MFVRRDPRLFCEQLAYDSWGKRRAVDGIGRVTDNKGFTGHEMLDQLDLVHMNGRIYDPSISRFVSADPYIQDPQESQSYNRYSYVFNNPTNLTDPTGFMADAGTVVVSGRSELNLLKWLDALLLSELKRDRAGIEYRQKNWKPADYKFERLVPRVYRAAIVDDPRTKGVRGFLIKFGLSLSIMQAETKKDDEALDASASGTNSAAGSPPPPDDDDYGYDDEPSKRGEKGQTFRGGKKAQRDNWYGQNDKDFQKWWHRDGKGEFNGGRDIQNSQNAQDAMKYWKDIGKPVPK